MAGDLDDLPARRTNEFRGIKNGIGGCTDGTIAACIQVFERHQLYGPGHPGDAHAIVADGTDCPGDVRAVSVVVERIVGVVHEVPAAKVVNVSVAVVVDAVGRLVVALRIGAHFTGVQPNVRGEVRVVVINARVSDANDDRAGVGADTPCLRRIDVRVGGAASLPDVMQGRYFGEQR